MFQYEKFKTYKRLLIFMCVWVRLNQVFTDCCLVVVIARWRVWSLGFASFGPSSGISFYWDLLRAPTPPHTRFEFDLPISAFASWTKTTIDDHETILYFCAEKKRRSIKFYRQLYLVQTEKPEKLREGPKISDQIVMGRALKGKWESGGFGTHFCLQ